MRIIAGKYKSRKICLPKGQGSKNNSSVSLRPTSDRARETLFDVLNNIADFENASCLDLFAGTGGIGFEALSRGAESAVFVDLSRKNLDAVKTTAAELGCSEQISVFREDALRFLKENSGSSYDFIFADPPYDYSKYDDLKEHVLKMNPVLFVLETSSSHESKAGKGDYNVQERIVGAAKFSIFISK